VECGTSFFIRSSYDFNMQPFVPARLLVSFKLPGVKQWEELLTSGGKAMGGASYLYNSRSNVAHQRIQLFSPL